jgi:hypothetical protein
MTSKPKLYGWYSPKQAKRGGRVLYSLPDSPSTQIVTHITRTPDHGTEFDDIRFLGEVGEFIERLDWGETMPHYSPHSLR